MRRKSDYSEQLRRENSQEVSKPLATCGRNKSNQNEHLKNNKKVNSKFKNI